MTFYTHFNVCEYLEKLLKIVFGNLFWWTSPLLLQTMLVCETLAFNRILTRLIARENVMVILVLLSHYSEYTSVIQNEKLTRRFVSGK
jgi:hypothetical protein